MVAERGRGPASEWWGAVSGLRGVSDILGILPDGRLLAVECKTTKGNMTADQDEFQTRISENNGVVCCMRSVG